MMSCKARQGKHGNKFTTAVLLLALLAALTGCSGNSGGGKNSSGGAAASDTKRTDSAGASSVDTAQTEGEDVVYPEWIYYDEVYKDTYMALSDHFSQQVLEKTKVLQYDKDEGCMFFDYHLDNEELMDEIIEVLKPVWEGRDLPMIGLSGFDFNSLNMFSGIDYNSLSLRLYVGEYNQWPDRWLSSLRDCKSLNLGADSVFYKFDTLPDGIEELAFRPGDAEHAISSLHWPHLKKLTLFIREDDMIQNAFFRGLGKLTALEEVCLYGTDGVELPVASHLLLEGIEELKALENIKRINGKDKDTFELAVGGIGEAILYYEDKWEELKEMKEAQGTPHVGDKVLIYQWGDLSVRSVLEGNVFGEYPKERLAQNLEDADTLLLLYAVHEWTGETYNNGMKAYRTYTMVVTVDLRNDDAIDSCVIGVKEPPSTIWIDYAKKGGDFDDNYAKTLTEEAEEYALGLF